MPVLSIGGYRYTATYLDNHSSFRVMFYLKNKSKEFAAFKAYKPWAEGQLNTTLKCKEIGKGRGQESTRERAWGSTRWRHKHTGKHTDDGHAQRVVCILGSIRELAMNVKLITYANKMQAIWSSVRGPVKWPKDVYGREWNWSTNRHAERFQKTIINGAEAMQHQTSLSNGFWTGYTLWKPKFTCMYNITLIKWADNNTQRELWDGYKPNISHLWVFGCLAWVHILKKRRHKLKPKSWEMIFIRYEPGSKGYQFWDAGHQQFKISPDKKFKETHFPAK